VGVGLDRAQKGVDLVEFGLDVIVQLHRLRFHGDPFDRAIVATAKLMDLPLITKDEMIVSAKLVDIAW
jgi:PIN domain nuclease of toxin-antitoxin system